MGLLDLLKTGQIADNHNDAEALKDFIVKLEPQLDMEARKRLYGDGTYSGYKTLRDFYKGRQWAYQKEEGETMRTYNYCFTIVENMTAFLTNESPQMSCPPLNVTDPIQRVMAEGRTKLLNDIHDANRLGLVFQRAARTASIYGDAYIFGAFPEFDVTEDSEEIDELGEPKQKKTLSRIRYWNVERPWTVRPIYRDDDFTEMYGCVKQYRMFTKSAEELFKSEMAEVGMTEMPGERNTDPIGLDESSDLLMTTIKEVYTRQKYILMVTKGNKILKYIQHDWGFIPIHHVPNIHMPGESRGTSDLENEVDPQQEYNERTSDFGDLIKELSKPTYWGKNLGNVSEVRSGQTVIYEFGEDAELSAMPKSGDPGALSSYAAERKNDIINLSGMNQVLYPGNQVLQATGRALSVVMQGVNNKISLRKGWWEATFKELNRQILFLAERYVPDAKILITGNYKSDVFITSVLMRSVVDEINKFQARLQSLTTTQKNIGVNNPSEEQKLMKEELSDELLVAEIAKQPGLVMQILAQRAAAVQQGAGDGAASPESAGQLSDDETELEGFGGGFSPISTESENAPGDNPAVVRGSASPVSPEGKVRQKASQAGNRTQVKKK